MVDYNWVLPNLALGSAPDRSWLPRMAQDGITDVLDVRAEADSSSLYDGTGITYNRVPMIDDGRTQPVSAYQQTTQIIENALACPNHKILVHCAAGEYRSPSVVYAYLRANGYSADQAWNLVLSTRTVAHDQYIAGAERAVPSLPTAPTVSCPTSDGAAAIIAITAAVVAGLGLYYYTQRPHRARTRRLSFAL